MRIKLDSLRVCEPIWKRCCFRDNVNKPLSHLSEGSLLRLFLVSVNGPLRLKSMYRKGEVIRIFREPFSVRISLIYPYSLHTKPLVLVRFTLEIFFFKKKKLQNTKFFKTKVLQPAGFQRYRGFDNNLSPDASFFFVFFFMRKFWKFKPTHFISPTCLSEFTGKTCRPGTRRCTTGEGSFFRGC